MTQTLKEAAHQYAEAGWPVFPIWPNEKIPLTEHGVKDATTDWNQIEEWWNTWPDANIGFCPEGAGMAVVDIDPGAPDQHLLIHPFMADTPRGGIHLFYAGSLPPTQSKIAEHVDTRGRNSYVLLAPSVVNGRQYEWQCEAPFGSWDLPDVPDWIVEACRSTVTIRTALGEVVEDKPAAVQEVRRLILSQTPPQEGAGSDTACYVAIAKMREKGLSDSTILDLMIKWTGFDEDWLQEKLDHVERYAQNERGCDIPLSSEEKFGSAVQNLASTIEQKSTQSRFQWCDPTDDWDGQAIEFYDEDHLILNIPGGCIGVVYGESGHHKTNTLLSILFQLGIERNLKTLYVAGEGVYGLCKDRTQAQAKTRNLAREWVSEHMAVIKSVPLLTDKLEVQEFLNSPAKFKPDIVIVDTLATGTIGVDENSKAQADILSDNGAAGMIKRYWNCVVIFVAHAGKDSTKGIRGHSGQFGAVDFIHHVQKVQTTGIHVKCEKMRDGDSETNIEAHYTIERTGIPVPVRVNPGQFKDATRTQAEDLMSPRERLVRYVLRDNNADAWERGIAIETLSELVTRQMRGDRPGELGDPGVAEWDECRLNELRQLKAALRGKAKWAMALTEEHIAQGGSVLIRRWFLPSNPLDQLAPHPDQ